MDLTGQEEAACEGAVLQVGVTAQGQVRSLQKRGAAALQLSTLQVRAYCTFITCNVEDGAFHLACSA